MRLLRVVYVALLVTAVGIAVPASPPEVPYLGWTEAAAADEGCIIIDESGNVTVQPGDCPPE